MYPVDKSNSNSFINNAKTAINNEVSKTAKEVDDLVNKHENASVGALSGAATGFCFGGIGGAAVGAIAGAATIVAYDEVVEERKQEGKEGCQVF